MVKELESSPAIEERIRRIETGVLLARSPWQAEAPRAPLAERLAFHAVPAVSIAVIHDGRVAWARAYGMREAGKPEPATPSTRFQAGSISKLVTAVAVLRLVEQGRLALDEDVNTFLKSWRIPANDGWQPQVTLRQLLSHTGGLTVHGFPGYRRDGAVPSLVQVLNGEPPANTEPIRVDLVPGTQFRYAGGGTTIVQQMMIDVCGQPFPAIMRELVLDPLGMTHSTFEQPLPPALWDQAATGHYWVPDNPVAGHWHIYPEMAAAGLWTTSADLARVALALLDARAARPGAILAAELVAQMLTRERADAGLGVFLHGEGDGAWFGHDGDDHGFVATLKIYKNQGLGVAIMTNGYAGGSLIEELVNTIAQEYGWPDYRPPAPVATPVDPLGYEAYVGAYELLPGAVWTVARDGDTLTVTPPGQNPIPLYPQSDTTFFMRAAHGEITFAPADDEGGPELIFKQNGEELRARRR